MSIRILKISFISVLLIGFLVLVTQWAVPPLVENSMNRLVSVDTETISDEARTLHADLTIMDWHADTLLWNRDFLTQSDRGQVDVPRLRQGNVALQMLTTVTKSPDGQNYVENDSSSDRITSLAIVQGWPVNTWSSLLERALYQAKKLHKFVEESRGQLVFIQNQADLAKYQARPDRSTAVLLGTEGAHPLEGELSNITRMYNAGFRMFGLTHFFDNELGGSLHGVSKSGLTDFGRSAVAKMDELEVIIDLAHASEAVAHEVLKLSDRAPVVSHTGFKGACDTPRNFPDELMQKIAEKGGLIAVGYWEGAICDDSPSGIAKSIKYGINLVGADHVALGSDWDGSVKALPSDKIAAITDALLKLDVSESDIRKVMGENSVNFLTRWLPAS